MAEVRTEKRCCNCDKDLSRSRANKYYYKNGYWDGKSYLCNSCYSYLRQYGTLDKEKISSNREEYLQKRRVRSDNKFKVRMCCICGGNKTYIQHSGTPLWFSHRCNKENCTGWLCSKCYSKFDPNSEVNIIKSMRQSREGTLSIGVTTGKGLIGEAIIAKVRNLKIISIELDNFRTRFDLSRDQEYGIIQSKLKTFTFDIGWVIEFGIEHNFDILLCLCTDSDMKNIVRVYAIPEGELYGKKEIYISKDYSVWEKFRIGEAQYDNVFHDLMLYIGDNKCFSIDDIRKWLESK